MVTTAAKYDPVKYKTPTGNQLSCKGWVQEAALRMLLNNLDPEVAERPDDLIVYGGRGKAARNFEALDNIIKALKVLENDETYEKFAKQVFENTMMLNKDKWDAFIAKPDTASLHKDLAYKTAIAFLDNFNNNYGKFYTEFMGTTYGLNKKYLNKSFQI